MTKEDELAEFHRRLGAAIWHIQYFEDILRSFLAMMIVEERRGANQVVSGEEVRALVSDICRTATGPLTTACIKRGVIRPEDQVRFEDLKNEIHWLMHRSLVENGTGPCDLGLTEQVITRIAKTQREAIQLAELSASYCESWAAAHRFEQSSGLRQSG